MEDGGLPKNGTDALKGGVGAPLDQAAIVAWLHEDDPRRLEELWRAADDTRRRNVGDEVHLRGLIELSNYCVRACGYCGLRAANREIERYRMSADEILECAGKAKEYGYGTVVLQSGEDYGIHADWMADVVTRIKDEVGLAVTLSLGERPDADLELWRAAGADRYLLRFETSDDGLYKLIHPDLPGRPSDRFAILRTLRRLGYEPGSGIMVGIPGQTWESVADDITAFRDLDLDMIGVGPLHLAPGNAARRPFVGARDRAGPADPQRRAHRLQGRGAHAPRVPRVEHPEHDRAGDDQQDRRARTGTAARRQHRHAQPDAARVSRALRDLPRQGLRERDRRDVPRLPAGPHRGDRPRGRQRPRGPAARLNAQRRT